MTNTYRICTKCIMDTTDPDIQFDRDGVCNHCRNYEERAAKELHYNEEGQRRLASMLEKIKVKGKNKEYDCIIGVSGGVDSTTVAYHVKQLGLRPLAIHLDNGWDSELSVSNIEKFLRLLDIELRTYVINWEEFKDLQLSFLKASVPNAEIPTDHAIVALLYRTAVEKRTPYIISGGNLVTEGVLPSSWGHDAKDWRYLKSIHKKYGNTKLKSFPHLNLFHWVHYTFVKGIKFIPILNYIPYDRKEAKKLIEKELGWRDYGAKHFESIYTRFFQGYILPTKFRFDKRRAHLSTLICSGQTTRDAALEEMKNDPYPNEEMLKEDREYIIKKLELTEEEFERIISHPIKTYKDYPNNTLLYNKLNFFVKLAHRKATHNE